MFQREGDFQGQVNQRLSVTQIPFPTLSFTINYWTEEPGRPQSMGSQESDTTSPPPQLNHPTTILRTAVKLIITFEGVRNTVLNFS